MVIGPGTEANLFALGLGAHVVGVSDFCTVPEAAALRRVGGLANPNLERVAALQPDLVLVQGDIPLLRDWCQASGVEFQAFGTDSVAGWRDEVRWIGNKFGIIAESSELLERANLALTILESGAVHRDRPRVLLIVSRRPDEASGLLAAGPSSFLSELLFIAGGSNVLAEARMAYVDVNEESLIRLDPEVIVEFWPEGEPAADPLTLWRRAFPSLSAVREGRIGLIHNPDALIPGPSMPETAGAIAALLAPAPRIHD